MYMNMRKAFVLLSIFIMLFCVSCANKDNISEDNENDVTEEQTEAETEAESEILLTYTEASKNSSGNDTCACSSQKYDLGDGCYLEVISHAPYDKRDDVWITSADIELRYTGECETDAELMEKHNFNDIDYVTPMNHYNMDLPSAITVGSFDINGTQAYESNENYAQSIFVGGYDGYAEVTKDNKIICSFVLYKGEEKTKVEFTFQVKTNSTSLHSNDLIKTNIDTLKENVAYTPLPGPQVEDAEEEYVKFADKITVACVGECITAGDMSSDSYPSQLQKILGNKYRVLNLGASGSGAQMGSGIIWGPGNWSYADSEYYAKAKLYKADIVIVMLGTNDAYSLSADKQETVDRFYNSLKNICETFRVKDTTKIYLCTSTYRDDIEMRTYNLTDVVVPMQKKLAEDMGYELLDLYSITQYDIETLGTPYLYDGVHFNDAGCRYLAEQIYLGFFADSNSNE